MDTVRFTAKTEPAVGGLGDPPEEPPEPGRWEMLWRIARRLYRDHSIDARALPTAEPGRCGLCEQPWPCSGRRLALLGLRSAAK